MACTCVLVPGIDCDGCQECEQGYDERFDTEIWDEIDFDRDRFLSLEKYKVEAMI